MVSLNPHSLQDLMDDMERVGTDTGLQAEAAEAVARMRSRVERCFGLVEAWKGSIEGQRKRPKV